MIAIFLFTLGQPLVAGVSVEKVFISTLVVAIFNMVVESCMEKTGVQL